MGREDAEVGPISGAVACVWHEEVGFGALWLRGKLPQGRGECPYRLGTPEVDSVLAHEFRSSAEGHGLLTSPHEVSFPSFY